MQFNINAYDIARIATVSPKTIHLGNPKANYLGLVETLQSLKEYKPDFVVFPELFLTGYTCGDLFLSNNLISECRSIVLDIKSNLHSIIGYETNVIFGCPLSFRNKLFNCAVVAEVTPQTNIYSVAKKFIPNYGEFYEQRWFASGNDINGAYEENGIALIEKAIFRLFKNQQIIYGVEICEDLWVPDSPSIELCQNGANLIFNLSASNELVEKKEYRRNLVAMHSAKCNAAYVYVSSGPDESTSDMVFSGHSIVANNGVIVAECHAFDNSLSKLSLSNDKNYITLSDVDVERSISARQKSNTFKIKNNVQIVESQREAIQKFDGSTPESVSRMDISPTPFVPNDNESLIQRCKDIFNIQTYGLAKRLKKINGNIYIGVSGGLDSTLALMVAKAACNLIGNQVKIVGITMPGFGTPANSLKYAIDLMHGLEIQYKTIPINNLCFETFKSINYIPFDLNEEHMQSLESFESGLKKTKITNDLVFENVQARERTKILMAHGFVVGTGNMTESALGWCTYNGDHMSMYNPNAGVPKTLVKTLVENIPHFSLGILCDSQGKNEFIKNTLNEIASQKASPQLLPLDSNGQVKQVTENEIGPFDLIDFFLFYLVDRKYSCDKILYYAKLAGFNQRFTDETIKQFLLNFIDRFNKNQFKRNCVPDSPKVGSLSLSPRSDWRMPSDL